MFEPWIYASTFATSLMIGLLFIMRPTLLLRNEHMISDLSARQSQHTLPTPRLGGLGVIIALVLGCLLSIEHLGRDLLWALVAGAVVFWAGLQEDIHRNVSPRKRLIAAFVSSLLAIALSGMVVPDLGLVTGSLLQWLIPAIAVTMVWSAGSSHALNLIDGLNGLSALYCMSAALGFMAIATQTGDTDIQIVSGLLVAAVFGFFILNWPFGRIFLGDAGAYGMGHILAWLGISLVARNPSVAGFAVLLLLFWPVCDTLFSIIRRRLTRRPTGQPDRLHFHHLMVRALPLIAGRRRRKAFDNPVATILLAPFFCTPIIVGVWLWDQPIQAALALMLFITLFMATYLVAIKYFTIRQFRWRYRVPRSIGRKCADQQNSPFSGTYTQDSKILDVKIFRNDPTAPWTLEVSAAGTENLTYAGKFDTDVEAWEHFQQAS